MGPGGKIGAGPLPPLAKNETVSWFFKVCDVEHRSVWEHKIDCSLSLVIKLQHLGCKSLSEAPPADWIGKDIHRLGAWGQPSLFGTHTADLDLFSNSKVRFLKAFSLVSCVGVGIWTLRVVCWQGGGPRHSCVQPTNTACSPCASRYFKQQWTKCTKSLPLRRCHCSRGKTDE